MLLYMHITVGRAKYEEYVEALNIPFENAYDEETNFKVAIRNYTSRRFIDINVDIRDESEHLKHLNAVKLLRQSLDSMDVYQGDFVIRWTNLKDVLVEQMTTEGNIIFEPGFTSTSANPNFEMLGKDYEYKVVIEHFNGVYIADYSEYPSEEEVLIPASSFYRVAGYDDENKTIYLTQLDPNSEEVNTEYAGDEL